MSWSKPEQCSEFSTSKRLHCVGRGAPFMFTSLPPDPSFCFMYFSKRGATGSPNLAERSRHFESSSLPVAIMVSDHCYFRRQM